MTSVVCWKVIEDRQESIWIVSDSKISRSNQNSSISFIHDLCPKIFNIPLRVCSDSRTQMNYEYGSIAFAFSGSTLIANITKDIFSFLLSSFKEIPQGFDASERDLVREISIQNHMFTEIKVAEFLKKTPSMAEISTILVSVLNDVLQSYGTSTGNLETGVEIVISGYCHRIKNFESYIVKFTPNDTKITCTLHDFINKEYLIIGDRKDEIETQIENFKENIDSDLLKRRAPLYTLAQVIDDHNYLTIGGYLQLVRCTKFGCKVMALMREDSTATYIGYKLNNFTNNQMVIPSYGNFALSPSIMVYPNESDAMTYR